MLVHMGDIGIDLHSFWEKIFQSKFGTTLDVDCENGLVVVVVVVVAEYSHNLLDWDH